MANPNSNASCVPFGKRRRGIENYERFTSQSTRSPNKMPMSLRSRLLLRIFDVDI